MPSCRCFVPSPSPSEEGHVSADRVQVQGRAARARRAPPRAHSPSTSPFRGRQRRQRQVRCGTCDCAIALLMTTQQCCHACQGVGSCLVLVLVLVCMCLSSSPCNSCTTQTPDTSLSLPSLPVCVVALLTLCDLLCACLRPCRAATCSAQDVRAGGQGEQHTCSSTETAHGIRTFATAQRARMSGSSSSLGSAVLHARL